MSPSLLFHNTSLLGSMACLNSHRWSMFSAPAGPPIAAVGASLEYWFRGISKLGYCHLMSASCTKCPGKKMRRDRAVLAIHRNIKTGSFRGHLTFPGGYKEIFSFASHRKGADSLINRHLLITSLDVQVCILCQSGLGGLRPLQLVSIDTNYTSGWLSKKNPSCVSRSQIYLFIFWVRLSITLSGLHVMSMKNFVYDSGQWSEREADGAWSRHNAFECMVWGVLE